MKVAVVEITYFKESEKVDDIAVEVKNVTTKNLRPSGNEYTNPEKILELYSDENPLPKQKISKKIWASQKLHHYNRLLYLSVGINLLILSIAIFDWHWWEFQSFSLRNISNMAVANLVIAVLVRQQHIVNAIFWICTRPSIHWPLWMRWNMAKVYHLGGIHSGCAASAVVWFCILTASLSYYYFTGLPGVSLATLIISYIVLSILACIVILALPKIRFAFHNVFERAHRFGGWSGIVLSWVFTILFLNDQSAVIYESVNFWGLLLTSITAIIPWLQLRKVKVDVQTPSSHVAIVELNHGKKPFVGSSSAISLNPILEWHAFANITSPNTVGYRLVISRAGDWTSNFIDKPPAHVWVKGIPVAGVGHINKIFSRVVWIATGSGIGPILAHLLHKKRPGYLIWTTRNPRETYGDKLVDEILSVQPNATIWDTTINGKPDMVKLAYSAYTAFNGEAVVCISNKKLTDKVVYGMESRGIPAFGAIWDS